MKLSMPVVPESPAIERCALRNGMRVMICRQPWLRRSSILLNVWSGCRDERLPGTAHLLEHLMFRGSKAHPSLRELSESFEAWGADFNAYTAREVTSFDVTMPSGSLIPVIGLLGECISHPRLTGIAAERDIIREEIMSDYDETRALINVEDLLVREFYGEAGHPIAGDPSDLDKLTRQEVQTFYRMHYTASNMLLVIAGAVGDSCEMLAAIEDAFSELAPSCSAESIYFRRRMPDAYYASLTDASVETDPCLVLKRYDGAAQSEALLGFLCSAPNSARFGALEMLVRTLDDGMASRLSRRLVEELALVYDAEAYLSATEESTLMQIRLSCRHRRLARLIEEVYRLLGEIARNPILSDEIDRLRRRAVWEHIGLLDSASSYAQWISTMEMQGISCDIGERCRGLLSVSGEEISAMASDLLEIRPHAAAIVGDIGERTEEEIRGIMKNRGKF